MILTLSVALFLLILLVAMTIRAAIWKRHALMDNERAKRFFGEKIEAQELASRNFEYGRERSRKLAEAVAAHENTRLAVAIAIGMIAEKCPRVTRAATVAELESLAASLRPREQSPPSNP